MRFYMIRTHLFPTEITHRSFVPVSRLFLGLLLFSLLLLTALDVSLLLATLLWLLVADLVLRGLVLLKLLSKNELKGKMN